VALLVPVELSFPHRKKTKVHSSKSGSQPLKKCNMQVLNPRKSDFTNFLLRFHPESDEARVGLGSNVVNCLRTTSNAHATHRAPAFATQKNWI
jgi:hypothetical protein